MEDLWSFDDVAKYGKDGSKWLAVGDDGKDYPATYVRKYEPKGVMFFAIPASVNILGYLEII